MSTTVNAADITSEYNYKKYITISDSYFVVLLSDTPITVSGISSSFGTNKLDPNTGIIIDLPSSGWTAALDNYNIPNAIILINTGATWETRLPIPAINNVGVGFVFMYEQVGTVSDTQPSGMPAIDLGLTKSDVQSMIDTQINATTSVTTSAKSIQTQVTNAYVDYSNGTITLAELQSTIDSLTSQLQTLNNNASATLADKVAINNAQLQVQIVQDAANNDKVSGYLQDIYDNQELTSACKSRIHTYQSRINTIYNNFTAGSITQSEAITQVRNYITDCHYYIAQATSQADIDAYNAVINAATGTIDSISNYKELDPDVSESAQQSDREELEYLENIEAETTDTIDSLKSKVDNSINESQANQVKNNVIAPILQNTLIVKVLPIAALFMVLAVTLGFKYRL